MSLVLFLKNLRLRELQSDDVFVPQDGLLVMEAESVPIVEPWKFENVVPGYNGTGYLRFDGNSVSSGNPLGALSYKFEIDIAGTYHLRMRARKNNTASPTTSNDCYTKLVGYPGFRGDDVRSFLGGFVKVNVWATRLEHIYGDPRVVETPTYDLSPGIYELQVSGRTKHFVIDRIILYHTGLVTDFFAREASRTESPRRAGGTLSPVPALTLAPVPAPVMVPVPVPAPLTLAPVPSPVLVPVPVPELPMINFDLMTARLDVDTVIQTLHDGDVLNRAETGTWVSIRATAPAVPIISRITFRYRFTSHVESLEPYLMGGNNGPKNTPVNYLKTTGKKTVSAKVYDGNGAVVAERTINFEIVHI